MKKAAAFAMMMLAACSFPTPSEEYACRTTDDCESGRTCTGGYCVTGGKVIDARDIDAGTNCASFTSRHFDACTIPAPDGPLDLSMAGTYTFNTAAGTLTDPAGAAVSPPNRTTANGLVISVQSFHVATGVTLRVTGTNPLIVAAWSTLQIDGIIDATSLGTPTTAGAGANPAAACSGHTGVAGTSGAAAGGGGGGGGQTAGARGGTGGTGNNGGGNGGTAITAAPLLAGGCAGATGGQGNSPAGVGGDGGGAIQLTARTSVTIAGKVLAGGAGGKQGQNDNNGGGGGGGGAGGMIGLEAPSVTASAGAILAANGGAGGEGSGNQGGTNTPGANGGASATPATNPNNGSGGNGGNGGAAATAPTAGSNDGAGGGGGGGGTGFITVKSAAPSLTGATISPPATMIP